MTSLAWTRLTREKKMNSTDVVTLCTNLYRAKSCCFVYCAVVWHTPWATQLSHFYLYHNFLYFSYCCIPSRAVFKGEVNGFKPPPKCWEFFSLDKSTKTYLMLLLKDVATRCVLRAVNASKCVCGRGSAPDPAGGAYDAPPDLLVGWEGALSLIHI